VTGRGNERWQAWREQMIENAKGTTVNRRLYWLDGMANRRDVPNGFLLL